MTETENKALYDALCASQEHVADPVLLSSRPPEPDAALVERVAKDAAKEVYYANSDVLCEADQEEIADILKPFFALSASGADELRAECERLRLGWWNDMKRRGVKDDDAIAALEGRTQP